MSYYNHNNNHNNYYNNYYNPQQPPQYNQTQSTYNNQQVNQDELSFDAEITEDEKDIILLNPGIYPFIVKQFKKDRTRGNEKNPPCNMVVVEIEIPLQDGQSKTMNSYLVLSKKAEWKLSQFFVSIGQKKKGEPLKMDWPKTIGARGFVEISTTTSNKGNPMNEINRFLEPQQSQSSPTPQPTQGTPSW